MREDGRGHSKAPEEVVRSWVRRYRNRMLRAARPYEGRAVTAEDIVQEAFRRAVQRFHTLRKQKAIGKWLVGITRRVGQQIARKRSRRERLSEQDVPEPDWGVVNPSRSEPDPRVELVMAAAELLPEAQREVMRLSLVEGMTVGGIAEALGRPKGTVRVYRHRAVCTLKALLRKNGGPGCSPSRRASEPGWLGAWSAAVTNRGSRGNYTGRGRTE